MNEYFIVQKIFTFKSNKKDQDDFNFFKPATNNNFWHYYLWQVYVGLVPLAFAATASHLLTDIAKYSVGRLRPHFIDLCRPQLPDGQVLSRESNCASPYAYVTIYQCVNLTAGSWRLKDAHLSFMSGHSSFAAVCLVYLIVSLFTHSHFQFNSHFFSLYTSYSTFYINRYTFKNE